MPARTRKRLVGTDIAVQTYNNDRAQCSIRYDASQKTLAIIPRIQDSFRNDNGHAKHGTIRATQNTERFGHTVRVRRDA